MTESPAAQLRRLQAEARKRGQKFEPEYEDIPHAEWFEKWCSGCSREPSINPEFIKCKTAVEQFRLYMEGGISTRVLTLDGKYICLDYVEKTYREHRPRPKKTDPRQTEMI